MTPHVRKWWDQNVAWDMELIGKKYGDYTKGFKTLRKDHNVIRAPIYPFIIHHNTTPIGYIQYYNKLDFPPEQGYEIDGLPDSCSGLDFYIGELEYIGKGIGSKALLLFLKEQIFVNFNYVFVDPDTDNIEAIKTYEKCGFKEVKKVNNNKITWMIRSKNHQE